MEAVDRIRPDNADNIVGDGVDEGPVTFDDVGLVDIFLLVVCASTVGAADTSKFLTEFGYFCSWLVFGLKYRLQVGLGVWCLAASAVF